MFEIIAIIVGLIILAAGGKLATAALWALIIWAGGWVFFGLLLVFGQKIKSLK